MCFEKFKEYLSEIATYWPGALGALISLRFVPYVGAPQTVLSVIGGAGAAVVVSPVVSETWGVHLAGAASFLVGLFSMTIFGVVFDVIDKIKKQPVRSVRALLNILIDVVAAARNGSINARNRKEEE